MYAFLNEIFAFSNIWATEIWSIIYQSALLACIIFMITRYRKISASIRFGLWMLVILRMLIMPVATVSLPVLPANEIVILEQQTLKNNDSDRADLSGSGAQVETEGLKGTANNEVVIDFRSSIYTGLFGLWVLGVMVFLLRTIRGWFKINNIIINGTLVEDQNIVRLAQQAAQATGLDRLPDIITTKENISSFVHGIFRPVVVLPRVITENFSEEQLLALFTHEFTHLKRFDPLVGWIVTICQVFYFFHPGYYLARYYILLDREIACDERVISLDGQCKSVYAQALINASDVCRKFNYQFAPKAVASESYAHLKKRLVHMADKLDNTGRMSISAIVFFSIMALISIPGISLTERSAAIETGANENKISTVPRNVKEADNAWDDSRGEILFSYEQNAKKRTDEKRNLFLNVPLVIAYSNNIAGYIEPCD